MKTVEEQLQELRKRWLDAKAKGDTAQMRIIEIRGKLLKKDYSSIKVDRVQEVIDIFGV